MAVLFVEVSWSAGGSERFRLALLEGVCIAVNELRAKTGPGANGKVRNAYL